MEYRALTENDATEELLKHFIRYQMVRRCWRKRGGAWVLEDIPFTEDWSAEDRARKLREIRKNLSDGGCAYGAFDDGKLKGLMMLERGPLGSRGQYIQVSSMHVSGDMRHRGIGRKLFGMGMAWARARGAEKLYISACSAEETIAFYHAMGCTEAAEYDARSVEEEPCDCQMECALTRAESSY